MLRVYLDENMDSIKDSIKDKEIITDVEDEFNTIALQDTPLTRKLLKEIEQGQYDTEFTFIDRFGVRLYTSELSSGCKTALLTEYRPDCIIDTRSCGFNARDAIISNCTTGSVIVYNTDMTFYPGDGIDSCDVCLDGYRFRTVERLNRYIQDEAWDIENMDLSDLERVEQ